MKKETVIVIQGWVIIVLLIANLFATGMLYRQVFSQTQLSPPTLFGKSSSGFAGTIGSTQTGTGGAGSAGTIGSTQTGAVPDTTSQFMMEISGVSSEDGNLQGVSITVVKNVDTLNPMLIDVVFVDGTNLVDIDSLSDAELKTYLEKMKYRGQTTFFYNPQDVLLQNMMKEDVRKSLQKLLPKASSVQIDGLVDATQMDLQIVAMEYVDSNEIIGLINQLREIVESLPNSAAKSDILSKIKMIRSLSVRNIMRLDVAKEMLEENGGKLAKVAARSARIQAVAGPVILGLIVAVGGSVIAYETYCLYQNILHDWIDKETAINSENCNDRYNACVEIYNRKTWWGLGEDYYLKETKEWGLATCETTRQRCESDKEKLAQEIMAKKKELKKKFTPPPECPA